MQAAGAQAGGNEIVGAVLDPVGGGGVGWAAVGRVVLEAAVLGWVVGGGDDDAVGEAVFAMRVISQDGVGEGGGGGVGEVGVDHGLDAVGGEDLEGGGEGGLGGGGGVLGEGEGAGGVRGTAVGGQGGGAGGSVGGGCDGVGRVAVAAW